MISPLHKPLPAMTPICNELAEFGGTQFRPLREASKLRFPHAGMGFALSHDRLPILSAPQMATNGRMSKPAPVFAATSPSYSTAAQRADYLHPVVVAKLVRQIDDLLAIDEQPDMPADPILLVDHAKPNPRKLSLEMIQQFGEGSPRRDHFGAALRIRSQRTWNSHSHRSMQCRGNHRINMRQMRRDQVPATSLVRAHPHLAAGGAEVKSHRVESSSAQNA